MRLRELRWGVGATRLASGVGAILVAWALMGGLVAAPALAHEPDEAMARALITPEQLAKRLKQKHPPAVIQIGFPMLYRQGHIPGAQHWGEAANPEGLAAIEKGLKTLPKDREIVLYCGCCPWDDCPNVRPAFERFRGAYAGRLKLLEIPRDFDRDWAQKGYPTAR